MKTRHKVPEVGKEPPESALEDQGEEEGLEGQEDEGEQLVISVQHDVNDPNTIVLVNKHYIQITNSVIYHSTAKRKFV